MSELEQQILSQAPLGNRAQVSLVIVADVRLEQILWYVGHGQLEVRVGWMRWSQVLSGSVC